MEGKERIVDIWNKLLSVREKSGFDVRLKGAAYVKHRCSYEGTLVPKLNVHDPTAMDALETYVDGLVGYVLSQNSRWFSLMPTGGENGYMGFGDVLDNDSYVKMASVITDCVENIMARSGMYPVVKEVVKDGEVLGDGYLAVDMLEDGGVGFRCLDPQQCVFMADMYGTMNLFMRKFRMSAVELSLEYGVEIKNVEYSEFGDTYDVYELVADEKVLSKLKMAVDPADGRKFKRCVYVYQLDRVVEESSYAEMPVFRYTSNNECSGSGYGNGLVGKYVEQVATCDDSRFRLQNCVQKTVDPPAIAHTSLRSNYSTKPKAVMFTGDLSTQGVKYLGTEHAANALNAVLMVVQDDRAQIRQLFDADLFKNIMSNADTRKTAYEVSEIKNESYTLLSMKIGGMLNTFISPFVKRVAKIAVRQELAKVNGVGVQVLERFIDQCDVMLDSVFVQRLSRYMDSQGISSGAQIMAAFAELSQSSVSEVVDVDKAIRGGLMAVGFPQYAIRTSQEIKKIRDAEKQAAEEARQAQLSEIKAKALSNTGRGMQAMNSSGVDVASAFGGGQGQ